MSDNSEKGPAPEIVLTDGPLKAAAWREEGEFGPFFNSKLTRRYSNGDGEVRETSSLRERDLLPAAELMGELHRTIRDRKRERSKDAPREQAGRSARSEDWHDEDTARKDLKRDRFKQDRRDEGTRRARPKRPSQTR